MAELKVTFHNEATIRVQAQIFMGRSLFSTSLASPGETILLPVASIPYDIYFKNSATGWEITRQLNSQATTITLLRKAGRYTTVGE
ncbi:MAG TPA: hypothetical protein VK879_05105 [Candidatus Sulfomarinibacteraceae bacterium]|nr:hypothetical protein [Candidatus Sulfomarinibacteraceae bacterium]